MKVVVTGASGAVGRALSAFLTAHGDEVVAWDRHAALPGDESAARALLTRERPGALYHLAVASRPTGLENEGWLVNVTWPAQLAALAGELGITFLFTSSVMVFTDDNQGPFTPESVPDARAGYGYEKLAAERAVRAANAAARVARLGWQIGDGPGSNNMIDTLERQMATQGEIAASRRWYPACSFLPDTAAALRRAAVAHPAGLYLVDGNRGWTFAAIVRALNLRHGSRWRVTENEAFVYDQRMVDPRLGVVPLSARLPQLGAGIRAQ